MFEWDEAKRRSTVEKHGIDFVDAAEIFGCKHLLLPAASELEHRQIAVGRVNDIIIAVVFTVRAGTIRLITARRARKNEREAYETQVLGRNQED